MNIGIKTAPGTDTPHGTHMVRTWSGVGLLLIAAAMRDAFPARSLMHVALDGIM